MIKNIKLLKKYRGQILFLAYEQIKKQYLETSFGIAWAVVKPMVFVFSFWFFFTIGLKHGQDVDGHAYVLYLLAGYMPWFVISELIVSGTNIIKSNSVLVKTIKFPVMALPLINVLSKVLVHIAVMILVSIFYMFYGREYFPDIYYINFLYYWFVMIVFFTSITFITSSLYILIKDVKPLIIAVMQPLFWITPVLYTPDTPKFELIMRIFDPFYFFIVGYRDTLLYGKFFYENIWYNVYIWTLILILYIIGIKLFNKIRPFMADLI